MRTLLAVLLLAFLAHPAADAKAPSWVFLEGPERIDGMRRGDVDGDGVRDVFVLHGRRLMGWKGIAGKLPAAKATWDVQLDAGVSFVDLAPGRGVLLYGTGGLVRRDLATGKDEPVEGATRLDWRDADGAVFADLHDGTGEPLLPTSTGLRWRGRDIVVPTQRAVTPAGPFLEDAATATVQRPRTWVGRSPTKDEPALWVLTGQDLFVHGTTAHRYTLHPMLPTGDRRLHDFDGDGLPEVFERTGNNQQGRYAVYRVPKPRAEGPTPLGAPASRVALPGYQLEPRLADVNGDGRDDVVVTSISLEGRNLIRAITSGRVTAETNLFLNGTAAAPDDFFAQEPDARVKSEVGVRLHFTYAGTIDVKRTFTIVSRGDFDGDGFLDLAIRTSPDTLTVRDGTKSGIWRETGRAVAIPPLGDHADVEGYAEDVNAGPSPRKDELLLIYRHGPGGSDRLCVLRFDG